MVDIQEEPIYNVLRTDILNLKLRPGMIISIKDISEGYHIGRTPVRDALIRLSKEGLITFLPQRGTMISKINIERAENERFFRRCVEENIMLEFMAACDLKAITELELSLEEQRKVYAANDCRKFLEEDIHFHSIFYNTINKSYCSQIINANSGDYRRIRLLSLTDNGIDKDVIRNHEDIVDAMINKDAKRVNNVFNHHINKLLSQYGHLIDKYPDLFERNEGEVKRKLVDLNVDFLVETKLRYHA